MKIVKIENLTKQLIVLDGEPILLDKDVAALYEVEPIKLRQQLKRNIDKFPPEYARQATDEELERMVSQNVTPSKSIFGGHNPWLFTEKGLYMVATILKSPKATEATFAIIETFAKIRQLSRNLNQIEKVTDEDEQKALVAVSSRALEEIIDIEPEVIEENDETVETETRIEINLGIVKVSRATKKRKKD